MPAMSPGGRRSSSAVFAEAWEANRVFLRRLVCEGILVTDLGNERLKLKQCCCGWPNGRWAMGDGQVVGRWMSEGSGQREERTTSEITDCYVTPFALFVCEWAPNKQKCRLDTINESPTRNRVLHFSTMITETTTTVQQSHHSCTCLNCSFKQGRRPKQRTQLAK